MTLSNGRVEISKNSQSISHLPDFLKKIKNKSHYKLFSREVSNIIRGDTERISNIYITFNSNSFEVKLPDPYNEKITFTYDHINNEIKLSPNKLNITDYRVILDQVRGSTAKIFLGAIEEIMKPPKETIISPIDVKGHWHKGHNIYTPPKLDVSSTFVIPDLNAYPLPIVHGSKENFSPIGLGDVINIQGIPRTVTFIRLT